MGKSEFSEDLKLIRCSEVYERMRFQRHHCNTTLLKHVLSVARVSGNIARVLKKAGVKVRERELYVAAICHDMGMTDRYDKSVYPTHKDLAVKHGERSVYYLKSILGDRYIEREGQIIRYHMFPMLAPPRCIEGWILIAADKFRTVMDFFRL